MTSSGGGDSTEWLGLQAQEVVPDTSEPKPPVEEEESTVEEEDS